MNANKQIFENFSILSFRPQGEILFNNTREERFLVAALLEMTEPEMLLEMTEPEMILEITAFKALSASFFGSLLIPYGCSHAAFPHGITQGVAQEHKRGLARTVTGYDQIGIQGTQGGDGSIKTLS